MPLSEERAQHIVSSQNSSANAIADKREKVMIRYDIVLFPVYVPVGRTFK